MPNPLRPQPPKGNVRFHDPGQQRPLDDSVIKDRIFRSVDMARLNYKLVDWERCEIEESTLTASTLGRCRLSDTTLRSCDLANTVLDSCGLQRVLFESSRLTGLHAAGCTLQNVRIVNSQADLSSWRFARLRRVSIENCQLSGSDWSSTRLDNVSFTDCALDNADFSNCSISATNFSACSFEGIRGVTGLRGATLDRIDLLSLTGAMAAVLGIKVVDRHEDRTAARRRQE